MCAIFNASVFRQYITKRVNSLAKSNNSVVFSSG